MNDPTVLLMLQLAMAGMLGWSCFCRVNKTNADTRREVRWAMWFEGVCAGLLFGAPFLPVLMPQDFNWTPGTTPLQVWLLLLLSIVAVQLVTAKYWQKGVPHQFQQSESSSSTGGGLAAAVVLALASFSLVAPRPSVAQQAQLEQPSGRTAPVLFLQQGEPVQCLHPAGCVAMVLPAYLALSNAAYEAAANSGGGAGCAPQRGRTQL